MQVDHHRSDPSIDQQLALRTAATNLTREFDGTSGTETRASGPPVVLFLCTHNAGRSQMALGFFEHLAGDRAIAWSGGSEPATSINPSAIAAMRERGIDISGEYPKASR